jgi:glutathione synthase/RimK-type ligase-like ATP-grasp enzyme
MKKVGIIYNANKGADWSIGSFKKEFEKRNIPVFLYDANLISEEYSKRKDQEEIQLPEFEKLTSKGYSVWMNRIYPSEANMPLINKGLNAVSWLSARNFPIINPLPACIADYDKKFAHDAMKKWKVHTPKTEILSKEMDAKYLEKDYGFPLIIKPNTGGTSIGVKKINSKNELEEILSNSELISGRNLVQKFVKPIIDHDVRIGVVNGEPLIIYGRSLCKNGNGEAWMGSYSHGSSLVKHEATEEEKRLAVLASKSLGATLNEVDIQITKEGPVIIENNLTPGYIEGEEKWIELIVNHIYDKHIKNEE